MTAAPHFEAAGTAKATIRSLDTFRDWLHHELASSSDIGFGGVDFSMSLDDIGLSSIHVVRLTGEIEKLLDIEIEATRLYDYPSIDAMCEALFRMRRGRQARDDRARLPVRVVGTFTVEPVEPAIRHLLGRLGWPVEVRFGGYNQVFQALLNPNNAFTGEGGANVTLVRIEDLFRHEPGPPDAVRLGKVVDELCRAMAALSQRGAAPTLMCLAPHSPDAVRRLGLADRLDALDARILAHAEATPGLWPVDLRRVEQQYPVARIWDAARDKVGHIPFTQGCYSAMGAAVARAVTRVLTASAKVIVLDCDNTLWGGVVGEVGADGVELSAPYLALQRFMAEQSARGKLLCLASKNNEAEVWSVFDRREMPLRREHIVAHAIDWQPKSHNIAALAETLGLGLDSVIFVDDNPMEVAEVAEALPQVLAIQVPAPARIERFFSHHWAFDDAQVTAEDRQRTAMMRQNLERSAAQQGAASIDDFLARLELDVDLAPVDLDRELARAAQLTGRTNQFNANKRVYDEAGFAALCREPARRTWRVRVRDRFGDYGFVGLVSGRPLDGIPDDIPDDTPDDSTDGIYACDVFLMSCRVLGRRVEQALLRRVAQDARDAGCPTVLLEGRETARNVPLRQFYRSLDGVWLDRDDDRFAVRFAAAEAEARIDASTRTAIVVEQTAPAAAASPRAEAAEGYAEIARIGPDVDALMTAIATSTRTKRPNLATAYVTPRTAEEKTIATIWREVLGVDRVGVHDDFYALGGDSLRAAEAFARMWDLGIPESISLQTIVEPTVATLARAVAAVKAGEAPTLLADTFSLADQAHLPDDICRPGYDVSTYDRPMRRVLLTGGTGYLGAYCFMELMQQTEATVTCLVRASTPEEGRERIISNLRRYDLWRPAYADRLDVVLGDLVAPRLGLDGQAWQALADGIDTILHSAAWVNFVYPYQHLEETNVRSTETILRLAVASALPIQLHFVSTLGVIMSTGYGRAQKLREDEPLTHCDDLLNGYEQTKYVSDVMVHTAFTERGIPGAIYRPGMVSGLSDGTYHKLDEFLPQFLKGCIQLGAWPLLDTTWEIAPVDFTCKAIVHIARQPKHLNRAYFVQHPHPRSVAEHIAWHRDQGYAVRGLPWDVWKRELLGLGTERLRKNALFPFVDFIRALSEEQVYFPPTDRTHFEAAIADMDFAVPDQLELNARYTQYFIDCDYYTKLPSGPRSLRPNERPFAPVVPGDPAQMLDERLRFDPNSVNFGESYYVLFNDKARGYSFVVRYVLFNGILEEDKRAEVWAMFRDRSTPGMDLAIRQKNPIGRALFHQTEAVKLTIGPSGFGSDRVWGAVSCDEGTLEWDLTLDRSEAIAVQRIPQADDFDLLPHFQSNGCTHHVSGTVTLKGKRYAIGRTLASDGHYWNTKNLRSWAWGHCAAFEGDPGFVFEGIGARFNDWSQTSMWLTFIHDGKRIDSNIIDAFQYNRELSGDTHTWDFVAERGNLRFVGRAEADPADMLLLVHPLPDDEYLYTHISYEADMTIDIERKIGLRWWKVDQRVARGTASFEVTRKFRNPAVTREFRIVRVK